MNSNFEKEVINCSRCGLCMDVCPVYKIKKTETSVSRGKFLQILGLIKGDLKYDKKISYNIDLCLGCNKCKSACPSGINAVEIFSAVKGKYQNIFEYLFYSAPAFKLKMFALKVLYKFKYAFRQRKTATVINGENIGYFRGCATKALGVGLNIKQGKFKCCALPFYIKGREDLYEKYKRKNIELINKYDKVVFDCATCFDTVSGYDNVNKEKLVYFTDFYKDKKLTCKNKCVVSFHKPCHLSYEKFNEIENILKNIENIQYERLENYDECCGFGGDFFTRHPRTASALSFKKGEDIINSKANIVLTTCPTCLWSLKYGIKAKKAKTKAFDLVEFLGTCKIL